jgi:hypothetical protein
MFTGINLNLQTHIDNGLHLRIKTIDNRIIMNMLFYNPFYSK